MSEPTYNEMIEQARNWPRDGFGEGRWFHAMADEMERMRAVLKRIASSHGASDHACFRRDLADRALSDSVDNSGPDA